MQLNLQNQFNNLKRKKMTEQKDLLKALAEFQQACPVIHKGTVGYGYSYAGLPEIFEIINPLLKKHGLGFTQLMDGDQLQTYVFHVKTGQNIVSSCAIPADVSLAKMNPFQAYGSGITYFRRYQLSAALGIVTDKDTDAAGTVAEKPSSKPNIEKMEPEELLRITGLCADAKTLEELQEIWKKEPNAKVPQVAQIFRVRKAILQKDLKNG